MVSRRTDSSGGVRACGVLTLLALAILPAVGSAQEVPAQPRDYVVDLAGVVDSATEARLNGCLQELERKTTAQMLVLTVQTTKGEPIRDFALRTANKWKLGAAEKNNGVLIVIAVNDHQWDVETGSGLRSVLPDAVCARVGREVFVPSFRKNEYSQGIENGTLLLASKVAAAEGVEIAGLQAERPEAPRQSTRQPAPDFGSGPRPGPFSGSGPRPAPWPSAFPGNVALPGLVGGGGGACCCPLFGVVLVLFLLVGLSHRQRGYRSWGGYGGGGGFLTGMMLGSMMSGQRHSGWGGPFGGGSWGGGGGSFGGGSFGGGGGGSFGGGGASGGW